MRLSLQIFILLSAATLAACATHLWHPKAPSWYLQETALAQDEVSIEQLRAWQESVLFIDARTRAEYDVRHLPNAILLNEQEADELLFDQFETLQNHQGPIVVYCKAVGCMASRRMKDYLSVRLPEAQLFVLRGNWEQLLDQSAP